MRIEIDEALMERKLKVVNMPVLLKEMQAAKLDAAVVASPENFFYLSGWNFYRLKIFCRIPS
jgi:Xaa-Pro aminopeptidase